MKASKRPSGRTRRAKRRVSSNVLPALTLYGETARVQRKQALAAHAALQDARDRFEWLYNHAPIGLASLTPSGVFVEINDTAAAILGERREQIVGKPLTAFVQRADTNALLAYLTRCREGAEMVSAELGFRHHQENRAPVQLTGRRIPMPIGDLYYTTILDITARRLSEDALRSSEKRYREIVETANEGICIVNIHSHITFVNRQFAQMLGEEIQTLLGQSMFDYLPEEDVAQARLAMTIRRGRQEPEEVRLRRADGRVLWTSVSTTLQYDERGRFSGMLKMYTDITDRKEHNAERARLVSQLVTAQEAERRRIARELHDQIGQHIVGFSLGLKRLGDLSGTGAPASEVIAKLKSLTEIMSRDLHHVALELRPTALDDFGLPDALAHYAEDFSRRTGIEADVHCDEHARINPTAETVIYRIAQEAMTNVLKHARAKRISVLLERRGSGVQLTIEDDGAGFAADRLLRFGSFEKRLGLTGMIERAALIGGELLIESVPGRGTTVILRVSAPAQGAPSHEETASTRRR